MVPSELDPKCQAARVWISAAVDGETTEIERAALRAHLAECPACREWAAVAESLVLHVRTAEPARPQRTLLLPPPAVLPQPVRRRRRSRSAVAVALGVAAIAAGVFAGTIGGGGGSPPSAPPGRVIVAINDAAPIPGPVDHVFRPQGR